MRLRAWMGFAMLALVLATASPAFSQVNAVDLSGQVLDPGGAAVPGAKVTIRNLATGLTRTQETSDTGSYSFVGLPPGRYELSVEKSGFSKLVAPELILTIGQSAQFNPQLQIAGGTEVIEIRETTELIETRRTAVAETIDTRRITNLPINGRNYVNFTLLTSQANRDSSQSIGAAPTSGINFGGQRARSNQVSVDGADAVDNSVNGIRATVSQEAVQEFQIIVSNYMPEFGRATGGVINIVTKGGSNEIHGNTFGYFRHKNIQARNPFSVEVDPATGATRGVKQGYTRVQAGATIGGPIQKDKAFYFFSYETTRRQESGFTSIGRGNFGLSNCTTPAVPNVTLQLTPAQCSFVNNPAVLTAPAVGGITGGQRAAQVFIFAGSGSSVALTGIDPGLSATVLFGLATAPGARFVNPIDCAPGACMAANLVPLPASFKTLRSIIGNFPVSEGTSLWSTRYDYQWNDRNSTFARVSWSPSTVSGIQVNAQNQNFGQNAGTRTSLQQTRDIALVTQHVTAVTNTIFNEFRFQAARRGLHYGFSDLPGGGDVAVDMLGFAHFGREPFSTVDRIERRFQWTDNVTWIKGRHNIKGGVDINLVQLRSKKEQIFELNFGGLHRFGGLGPGTFSIPSSVGGVATPSFTAPQAYGLGIPQVFIQGIGKSNRPFSNKTAAWFLQDSWKVHQKLTLNYGVRYDIELLPVFTPATQLNQVAEPALNLVEGIPTDRNNWSPRFALAWDPWGKGNTVVRAGYGLFYDHPLLAVAFNSTTAEGALSTQLITAGAAATRVSAATNPTGAINASSIFQGVLNQGPLPLGFLPAQQRFDPKLSNSLFANQNFIRSGVPIPLLPFTLHVAGDFQYGYAQQANMTIEQKMFGDYKLSVGYSYTHGVKLNRPRNITPPDPALLAENFRNALAAGQNPASPLSVAVPAAPTNNMGLACDITFTAAGRILVPGVVGVLANCPGPLAVLNGQTVATPAIFNFFRRIGPNPSFAGAFAAQGGYPFLVTLARQAGFPQGVDAMGNAITSGTGIQVPWSDVVQQESSGNSVYHGMTVGFSKRFAKHFEFLSSYTWSHAIDDSSDLQTLLAPQDNRRPDLERANSTFDQRHRWVTSAVFESPYARKDGGINWLLADWIVAPIFEWATGRPFSVFSASDLNLDFGSSTDRPSVLAAGQTTPFPTAQSPFLPGVTFTVPMTCDRTVTLGTTPISPFIGCTGNLSRNAFRRPDFTNLDLRVSRKFWFTERVNLEFITDMFNLANKFNVADVSILCDPRDPSTCRAGEPTAAYDPRQFQFALKINW
jgi:hypothetical protein